MPRNHKILAMKSKLNIRFIIRGDRINQKGLSPLLCRLTYNKKRHPFSTGLFLKLDDWDNKRQLHTNNDQFNKELEIIRHELKEAYLKVKVQKNEFTIGDIYSEYRGISPTENKSLLEVFKSHNQKMKSLIGIDYTKGTWKKFEYIKSDVKAFIKKKYGKSDILLKDLKLNFLHHFEYYLKTVKGQKQITVNKAIQRLRKIIKLAIAEGYILQDPFLLHKPKAVQINVVFLTAEELAKVEVHQFSQPRLNKVRDCFIFCCYTGLPYQEMSSLLKEHIITGFDGELWIKMYRKKTKKMFQVPLLPKAIEILMKYEVEEHLLPKYSNQKFNSYLKEIADIVGIDKRLTHHTARKTFASTVLLFNDIPIEVVSELLGHTKIATTQKHYGKVVQKKISEQMKSLKEKLEKGS